MSRFKRLGFGRMAMQAAMAAAAIGQVGAASLGARNAMEDLNRALPQESYADVQRRRNDRDRRDRKRKKKLRRASRGRVPENNRKRRAAAFKKHKRDNPEIYAMTNWQMTRYQREVAAFRKEHGRDPTGKQREKMALRWAMTPRRDGGFLNDPGVTAALGA